MSGTETRTLAITQLAGVRVAVDIAHVTALETPSAPIEAVDIALLLHLALPDEGRTMARLSGSPAALLLGHSVTVMELRAPAFHPLPELVAEHLRLLAIEALVALDDGFAYLLAPGRLSRS